MSWAAINLYNLFMRSKGAASGPDETTFKRTFLTLFQQRWKAKRLVRGYHGDYIGEKKFKKWYLPELIPDVRPRRPIGNGIGNVLATMKMGNRSKEATNVEKRIKKDDEELARSPVGSLMFIEIEKRIDTIVFRSCLTTSVYQARHLVLAGRVKLNGVVCKNPAKRLEPGDMISVDPDAISFLRKPASTTDAPHPPSLPNEAEDAEREVPQDEGEAKQQEDVDSEASSKEPEETEAAVKPDQPSQQSDSKYKRKLAAKSQTQFTDKLGYHFDLPNYAAPFIFIPAYLEVSFVTCSAVYVRHPTARPGYSELPTPYDADGEVMRLAWEWYVKVRPRTRGKLQRETGPHGTKRPVPYWTQYQQ